MIGRLLDYLILFKAFSTPYPYLGIVGLLLFILLLMGAFLKVQNGPVGWMFYLTLLCTGVWAFAAIMAFDKPGEYPELDGKKVDVILCTDKGIRVDDGKLVMPAGIDIPARYKRFYINPVEEMERVINNNPVRLDWSGEMDGYTVTCDGGIDLGEALVSKGLAKTSSLASDNLRRLEKEAKLNRIGLWARVRRGGELANECFVAEYFLIASVIMLMAAHFLILYIHRRRLIIEVR